MIHNENFFPASAFIHSFQSRACFVGFELGFVQILQYPSLHIQKHKTQHIWHNWLGFYSFWSEFGQIKVCVLTHTSELLYHSVFCELR